MASPARRGGATEPVTEPQLAAERAARAYGAMQRHLYLDGARLYRESVPPAPGVTTPRISVQWRWTSGRGRPVIGASYRAPRTYSRR